MPLIGENGFGGEESGDFSGESSLAASLGRISGKLLNANLLRNGVDLTFRNAAADPDLLYLDVNNGRVGIKNDAPNFDLEVDTDIHAVDANITSTLYADNFIISSNQITTASGAIHVYPGGPSPIAYFNRITSDDLVIDYNTIRSIDGENIQLDPNGTGTVELFNTTNVDGDLNVSGNVDVDGDLSTASNIFIGDAVYDVVTVTTRFDTELLPKLNNVYSIGTADFRWNETFFDSAYIDFKMFVGSFTLYQNEILTSSQDLIFNITGANPVANLKNINNNDLLIAGKSITNINTNEDIILATSGTGSIELKSTTNIDGGLNIVGNAYIDGDLSKTGNLIVGDTIYDNVTIVPDFSQSLIPGADATYDLGREQGDSTTGRWNDIYIKDISNIDNFTFSVVTISDQVEINGLTRTIQTIQSNDNLVLNPDTGVITIEELEFDGAVITNLNTTTPVRLDAIDDGYYVFSGNNGIVIPAGDTASRPASPEIGDTRWNNQLNYLECFDGSVYQIATGGGAEVTEELMEDLGYIYTIILG
jgi:cytoskeletal protein CcmA (bactofilin family)